MLLCLRYFVDFVIPCDSLRYFVAPCHKKLPCDLQLGGILVSLLFTLKLLAARAFRVSRENGLPRETKIKLTAG